MSKFNVDGAVLRNGRVGAVGVVCRSEMGEFLGSSAMVFSHIADPLILETLACREAQALASDLLIRRLYVASDCLSAVKEIEDGSGGDNAAIVHEIIARSTDFDECCFSHESRNCNFEAHYLAKISLSLGVGRHLWLGVPHAIVMIPLNIE